MRSLMRADTPLGVRLILAGVAAAGADGVAFVFLMRARPLNVWSVLTTLLLVCAGYVALGSIGTARRPRLPLEATIGIGMIVATGLVVAMPFPPRAPLMGSEVTLVLVLVLSGLAVTRPGQRARVGWWLLILLAGLGTLITISACMLVATRVVPSSGRFPLYFLELISGASLVAAWHGRALRPSRTGSAPRALA